jgi:hypothetical protein
LDCAAGVTETFPWSFGRRLSVLLPNVKRRARQRLASRASWRPPPG